MTPYYSDGAITIYLADCLDVLPTLGTGSIDALVTDPPYSSGGAFRGDRMVSTLSKYISSDSDLQRTGIAFSGDNRDQRSFFAWSTLWLNCCRQASKPGATIAMFSDWRQLPTMTDALQAGGWVWRGVGVWSKKYGRPRDGGFSSACEFLPWGTHGPLIENKQHPAGIVECAAPPSASRDNIVQKPESVMAWAIANVSPGALILDPFMGSGTTLVAAKRAGVRAIGIEVNEIQCEAAVRRLSQASLGLTDAPRAFVPGNLQPEMKEFL